MIIIFTIVITTIITFLEKNVSNYKLIRFICNLTVNYAYSELFSKSHECVQARAHQS